MAIDVGGGLITIKSEVASGITYVVKNNPANANGIITSISISQKTTIEGVQVAIFIASGNDLTTRDIVSLPNRGYIGSATLTFDSIAGDFSPLEIQTGDYIGVYFSSGTLNSDTGDQDGMWDKNGDYIPCADEPFGASNYPDDSIYLSGAGYQLGRINIGDSWKEIQNIEINIGNSWKGLIPHSKINIGDIWKNFLY